MSSVVETGDGAEVIELGVYRKRVIAEPLLTVEGRREACNCRGFRFDMKWRAVWCKKCGREWDAFDALVAIAENWRPYAENLGYLRSEEQRLREEVEQLRKDIVNLKAKKRRADKEITALVRWLKQRLCEYEANERKIEPKARQWASGFTQGLRNAIDLVESGAWRKEEA